MGQEINVSATSIDDVLILDTDRTVSGQDGGGFSTVAETEGDDSFPARLAARLLTSDDQINHVFAASNAIVVRRNGGWPADAEAAAIDVVESFFVFY
ncbi:MAG: hypothetical protein KJO36_12840 [Acidimicrobiia bacterium]|nr:hypothetical protein [Acidimicrobiia bacterium]MBT8250682.1 hypothetical protein [Acidimicrobiia bacterium]NND12832.1 hypothetical protein [Acidimicrobiia bacterium]NNL28845.1 hypothetical protein [Acidimicrobiia bacterium]